MHQTYGAVVTTHRVVRSFLRRVEDRSQGDPSWRDEVRWLAEVLPAHFGHEEADDGFFEDIRMFVPGGRQEVEVLLAEHRAMERQVALVLKVPEADVHALARAVRALAEDLAAHESKEAELALAVGRSKGRAAR